MSMTHQEIFDKAWLGLKAQGFKRAWDESHQQCVYRAPDGLRCAIGHCIPDEVYDPEMEKLGAINGLLGEFTLGGIFYGVDVYWLIRLQACHDDCDGAQDMEEALRFFAAAWQLTIPEGEAHA